MKHYVFLILGLFFGIAHCHAVGLQRHSYPNEVRLGADRPSRKGGSSTMKRYCSGCGKEFYWKGSLTDGYCAKCYCTEHKKPKINGKCRNCVATKMKKDGVAKCDICGKTSKEIKLLYNINGTSFPIEFYCTNHLCLVHNMPFRFSGDVPVCPGCLLKEYKDIERKYNIELKIASSNPEKYCDIHKWKPEYAPIFGGDYYTSDVETKYAQNYMKALELQVKGVLKCSCDEYRQSCLKILPKLNETKLKLDEVKRKLESLKCVDKEKQ